MIKTVILSLWFLIHPVHVSFMSIDYVSARGSLDIFLKLYYDDFLLDSGFDEKSLKFKGNDIFTKDFLGKYVNDKLKIIVEGRQLSGKINGYSLMDNELTMNLSFGPVEKITTLTVKNLIMTGIHDDQANMLIVRINDFEKGVRMTPVETEQTFQIN